MLPELTMMRAREGTRARETPVLSHDEGPELCIHARRAHGRGVPADAGLVDRRAGGSHTRVAVGARMLEAAIGDQVRAAAGHELLCRTDELRDRCLGVDVQSAARGATRRSARRAIPRRTVRPQTS